MNEPAALTAWLQRPCGSLEIDKEVAALAKEKKLAVVPDRRDLENPEECAHARGLPTERTLDLNCNLPEAYRHVREGLAEALLWGEHYVAAQRRRGPLRDTADEAYALAKRIDRFSDKLQSRGFNRALIEEGRGYQAHLMKKADECVQALNSQPESRTRDAWLYGFIYGMAITWRTITLEKISAASESRFVRFVKAGLATVKPGSDIKSWRSRIQTAITQSGIAKKKWFKPD